MNKRKTTKAASFAQVANAIRAVGSKNVVIIKPRRGTIRAAFERTYQRKQSFVCHVDGIYESRDTELLWLGFRSGWRAGLRTRRLANQTPGTVGEK